MIKIENVTKTFNNNIKAVDDDSTYRKRIQGEPS